MEAFDALRLAVAKVDALAAAAEDHFDNTMWDGEIDGQQLERTAHLIGLTREAAEAAVVAVEALNAAALNPMIDGEAGRAQERW